MAEGGYDYEIETVTTVALPPSDVFAFLSNPASIVELDSPWTEVRVLHATPACGVGAEIEYLFRFWGFPQYLHLVVTSCQPPVLLEMEQVEGPWHSCKRTCTLAASGPGTVVTDRVSVRVGANWFERGMHRLFTHPRLAGVLRHRHVTLARPELWRTHE